MLTGYNNRTGTAVSAELGINPSHTHAEAFPEQKASVVRQLQEQGKTVAFVGDGINDSLALADADVSVSFANGSEIARETADVVLMENSLHYVRISKIRCNMRENADAAIPVVSKFHH